MENDLVFIGRDCPFIVPQMKHFKSMIEGLISCLYSFIIVQALQNQCVDVSNKLRSIDLSFSC